MAAEIQGEENILVPEDIELLAPALRQAGIDGPIVTNRFEVERTHPVANQRGRQKAPQLHQQGMLDLHSRTSLPTTAIKWPTSERVAPAINMQRIQTAGAMPTLAWACWLSPCAGSAIVAPTPPLVSRFVAKATIITPARK
jgi:hypothetical protein